MKNKKKSVARTETVTIEVPLNVSVNFEDSIGDEEFKQSIGRLRKIQIQKEKEKIRLTQEKRT